MNYREATSNDIAAIAALHAASWRFAYRGAYSDEYLDGPVFEDRLNIWQERLSSPAAKQFVMVAEENGRMAGFACAYGNHSVEHGTLLDNLHVHPDLHGRGIGKRLVLEVTRWCAAEHADKGLYLGVLEQNENAKQFYKRLAARDVRGEIARSPAGDEVPSRIYAWTREQVAELAARS